MASQQTLASVQPFLIVAASTSSKVESKKGWAEHMILPRGTPLTKAPPKLSYTTTSRQTSQPRQLPFIGMMIATPFTVQQRHQQQPPTRPKTSQSTSITTIIIQTKTNTTPSVKKIEYLRRQQQYNDGTVESTIAHFTKTESTTFRASLAAHKDTSRMQLLSKRCR